MVRTRLNIGCRYSTPVRERPLHPTRSQFTPEPSQTQAPVTPATEPERRAGGSLTTHGDVSVCSGVIPFVKLPEIGADRAVLPQIGPVGRDVGAPHRVPVDDVKQMLPRPRRGAGGPVARSAGGRLGPSVQPLADLARNRLARPPAPTTAPVRREFLGGEQHGGDMLAVETDRTGAMPLNREQSPVSQERDDRQDRVQVRTAPRGRRLMLGINAWTRACSH